ncbi:MAG: GPR endopeptidase [Eubacteriales bacterium]|jgi:spore protease
MNDRQYAHSDLAVECGGGYRGRGAEFHEEKRRECEIQRLDIRDREGAEAYGKPEGRYVTVTCGKMWEMDDERTDEVGEVLADELREMAKYMCKKELNSNFGVLVVGLGNSDITPDAIGPETVRRIEVTRHLHTLAPDLYNQLGSCEISALAPGVLGQTGIETVELVRGATENARPDLIVAIDALAARAVSRLATTIQLSDNGINPGSGIGNRRRAVCRENVGRPVLAVGVPTVVDSSTLVYDALSRAGIGEISDDLRRVLEEGREFFVSPKESDIIMKKVAVLLARAIGMAFRTD